MRRRGFGQRLQPHAGDLDPDAAGRCGLDDEFAVQPRRRVGQRPRYFLGRERHQVTLVEVLAQLALVRRCPAGTPGQAEPGQRPSHVGERRDGRVALGFDGFLQRGPARLLVFTGDGELSQVERLELPGGETPFRLELQIAEAGVGLGASAADRTRQSFPSAPVVRDIGLERTPVLACIQPVSLQLCPRTRGGRGPPLLTVLPRPAERTGFGRAPFRTKERHISQYAAKMSLCASGE